MSYIYSQSKGTLSHNGSIIATGYSGFGVDKNNPSSQEKHGLGPIPRGNWHVATCINAPDTGPISLILTPWNETETYDRSGFRIHGDSVTHPGDASHGCIIIPRVIRQEIWTSEDHTIEVIE